MTETEWQPSIYLAPVQLKIKVPMERLHRFANTLRQREDYSDVILFKPPTKGFSCLQFKKSIVATGRDDYIARVGIYIKDLRETLNELFNTNGNAIIDYSIEPPRVFF